jgi:hypothetical protein
VDRHLGSALVVGHLPRGRSWRDAAAPSSLGRQHLVISPQRPLVTARSDGAQLCAPAPSTALLSSSSDRGSLQPSDPTHSPRARSAPRLTFALRMTRTFSPIQITNANFSRNEWSSFEYLTRTKPNDAFAGSSLEANSAMSPVPVSERTSLSERSDWG